MSIKTTDYGIESSRSKRQAALAAALHPQTLEGAMAQAAHIANWPIQKIERFRERIRDPGQVAAALEELRGGHPARGRAFIATRACVLPGLPLERDAVIEVVDSEEDPVITGCRHIEPLEEPLEEYPEDEDGQTVFLLLRGSNV